MADNVVTFLLENLTQLLTQEAKLLCGVEGQVKLLKNDLSLINVFLQKTAGNRHDTLVKVLVSQIRDVAYEAEDVIDTFIVTVTKHRNRNILGKVIHSLDKVSAFREVANKIDFIKQEMNRINNKKSEYGIEIAESSGANTEAAEKLHRRRRYVEEDHVVGFGHDTQALMKQLTEGSLQLNVGVAPMPKLKKFILRAELKEELLNGLKARYLSIRSYKLPVIPESICNLCNPETLDMRNFESGKSTIQCLPKGIWKLQKLRHLCMDGPISLPGTRNEIALPNLEILTGIAINQDSESLFAKAKFPSLSLTKITFVDADLSEDIMRVLGCLTNLRILKAVTTRANAIYMDIRLNLKESSFSKLEVLKMVHMHVLQWTMAKGCGSFTSMFEIDKCASTVADEGWMLMPKGQCSSVLSIGSGFAGCGSFTSMFEICKCTSTVADEGWTLMPKGQCSSILSIGSGFAGGTNQLRY
nr:putative disease resistance protein rxw24l [Quercus suber]